MSERIPAMILGATIALGGDLAVADSVSARTSIRDRVECRRQHRLDCAADAVGRPGSPGNVDDGRDDRRGLVVETTNITDQMSVGFNGNGLPAQR